jgi:hypothetical protein
MQFATIRRKTLSSSRLGNPGHNPLRMFRDSFRIRSRKQEVFIPPVLLPPPNPSPSPSAAPPYLFVAEGKPRLIQETFLFIYHYFFSCSFPLSLLLYATSNEVPLSRCYITETLISISLLYLWLFSLFYYSSCFCFLLYFQVFIIDSFLFNS